MKIYLVGGFIRDKLLGINLSKDRDWLVVGSNYKEMLYLGYKQIGNSFPIFIHPITKEEYALARKEKKNGFGYKGFICNCSSNISLEDDLFRRDLTINAIAMDLLGKYYDPFGGINDIQNKIIKHISCHFLDDPLRIFRVARFYSYLFDLNFVINKNTFILMKKIVNKGELIYITPERIWIELKKVFNYKNSFLFFITLYKCNAIYFVFPEIVNIFLNNKNKYYFILIFKKLDFYNYGLKINFIFFCFFFYYTILSKKYFLYKEFIINKVNKFCLRLRIPNKFFLLFKKIFLVLTNIYFYNNKDINIFILNIFYKIDIWRDTKIVFYLLKVINILKILKFKNLYLLKFLKKNIIKLFNLLKNFKLNKFINFKKKHINIKKNIYNLRLLNLKNFLKIINK